VAITISRTPSCCSTSLDFKRSGQAAWTKLTQDAIDAQKQDGQQHQVAIVLDNEVISAPSINEVIPGSAIITGTGINQDTSKTLATQLKFGSLPLSFKILTTDSVSATLGLAQMKAGLLAGAIGLVLVVIYCLIYYRALGLVVIASLAASASIVFASLVLLGRSMGFTLSLAGIAGFIVAIGITADSFVVFFERLKDEVKEGRSVRSAVPRAWVRARRTILSADAVSLLAAVVLYWLASGQVAGFAFTLGLSTIIDLLIVFLFTHPLVSVLAGSRTFTSPKFSGLGGVRESGSADAAASTPAARVGAMRTKES
jgi:preprotein translocase subunit SecD